MNIGLVYIKSWTQVVDVKNIYYYKYYVVKLF